jgi:hypothetical protein
MRSSSDSRAPGVDGKVFAWHSCGVFVEPVMFMGGVVLLGLCGAELDVAVCSLAVLSTGRGWLTDEPFSLPSVFSLGALG